MMSLERKVYRIGTRIDYNLSRIQDLSRKVDMTFQNVRNMNILIDSKMSLLREERIRVDNVVYAFKLTHMNLDSFSLDLLSSQVRHDAELSIEDLEVLLDVPEPIIFELLNNRPHSLKSIKYFRNVVSHM